MEADSILNLWVNLLISSLLKLLIYSASVWWKCGHYPPICFHIVVPVGSIHPRKVYSWGQASALRIINRTELSDTLRIWLHLAGRYRFGLWNAAILRTHKHGLIKTQGWVLFSFSLTSRTMTNDLTICSLCLHSCRGVHVRQDLRFNSEIVFAFLS